LKYDGTIEKVRANAEGLKKVGAAGTSEYFLFDESQPVVIEMTPDGFDVLFPEEHVDKAADFLLKALRDVDPEARWKTQMPGKEKYLVLCINDMAVNFSMQIGSVPVAFDQSGESVGTCLVVRPTSERFSAKWHRPNQ
jgi:hypothetical protein